MLKRFFGSLLFFVIPVSVPAQSCMDLFKDSDGVLIVGAFNESNTVQLRNSTTMSVATRASRGTDNYLPTPRYDHNQDSIGWFLSPDARSLRIIVADGMGGYKGGSTASGIAVSTLLKNSELGESTISIFPKMLERMSFAHDNSLPTKKEQIKNMGATVTVVEIRDGQFQSFHVGDTRAMIYGLQQVIFETQDHKIMRAPDPTKPEEKRMYVTRALKLSDGKPQLKVSTPEVSERIPLANGDVVVVASDGVWDVITSEEVGMIIDKNRGRDTEEIRDIILDIVKLRRSSDNISIVVLRYDG